MIFCSQMETVPAKKREWILEDIRRKNPDAVLYEGDFRELKGEELLKLLDERTGTSNKG